MKWRKKTDYITNQYQLLAESKIDTNGLVTLNKKIEKIELTEIVIGKSFGLLYLDTATQFYNIYFPKDTVLDTMSLKKNQIQLVFLICLITISIDSFLISIFNMITFFMAIPLSSSDWLYKKRVSR